MTDPTSTSPQPGGAPGGVPVAAPDPDPEPSPVVTTGVRPRSRAARALNVALVLALAVAVGGIAFAIGRSTAPSAAAAQRFPGGELFNGQGSNGGQQGGGPGGFAGAGGLAIEGTVTAVDADSVTVKTAAGGEIRISTTGDTTYHQQAAATGSDVTTGSTVIVRVDGFRGRGDQGAGPGSSPAPSGAARSATATDITVVP